MSDRKISEDTKKLMRARKLIEQPENWTQGIFARTKEGMKINPQSYLAYSFCIIGALQKVRFDNLDILHNIHVIINFNDMSTHDEVLRFLDRAILKSITQDQKS